jgi:CheY-like chemotaxis protein/HPt (histidine-containing phosphotransfer) domain-containing protein
MRWALAVALTCQAVTLWGLIAAPRVPRWLVFPFGILGLFCVATVYFGSVKRNAHGGQVRGHLGDASSDESKQQTRKTRILLAEDSEDNQALISTFLRQAGWEVVIAANGVEAVRLATSQAFDLVLMDVQMPEMDGHAATRELRKGGFTKPILALTADTTPEARGACLAAGCTEYLRKPVNRGKLLAACQDFLGGAGEKRESPAYEQAPLRSVLAGDPRIARVIDGFVSRLPQRVSQLAQCIESGNVTALKREAHNLKGAGAGYGFAPLSESAERVEEALRDSETLDDVRRQVDELIALIRQVEGYDRRAETRSTAVTVA